MSAKLYTTNRPSWQEGKKRLRRRLRLRRRRRGEDFDLIKDIRKMYVIS